MPNKITFQHDPRNDVVIARPTCVLNGEDDVREWYQEYERYFSAHFDRKMDVILDLTDFDVSAAVGPQFGAVRAEIIKRFFNRSYRVKTRPQTSTFTHTSFVIHGATDNDFPSVEAATAALLTDRAVG